MLPALVFAVGLEMAGPAVRAASPAGGNPADVSDSPVAQTSPQDIADRAEAAFSDGRFEASVEEFDRLAALVPSVAPMLWQRGIALYFLGRFEACASQFESYFKVDRSDLENASWHLLCAARAHSLALAREHPLDAGPDRRILRQQIYDMLRGRLAPDDLVAQAAGVETAEFYAHLYAGLLFDVMGDSAQARLHLEAAASNAYRDEGDS